MSSISWMKSMKSEMFHLKTYGVVTMWETPTGRAFTSESNASLVNVVKGTKHDVHSGYIVQLCTYGNAGGYKYKCFIHESEYINIMKEFITNAQTDIWSAWDVLWERSTE